MLRELKEYGFHKNCEGREVILRRFRDLVDVKGGFIWGFRNYLIL